MPAAIKRGPLPIRGLQHVSLCVLDVDASARFYSDVLGFAEVKRPESFDFDGCWYGARKRNDMERMRNATTHSCGLVPSLWTESGCEESRRGGRERGREKTNARCFFSMLVVARRRRSASSFERFFLLLRHAVALSLDPFVLDLT